jgi:hypothetical protein
MGMLAKASGQAHEEPKKEAHKKKQKRDAEVPSPKRQATHAGDGPPPDSPTPDDGPAAMLARGEAASNGSGGSQEGVDGEQDNAPEAQADSAPSDSDSEAGGAADDSQAPQAGEGQPDQDDQGDQGDGEQEAAPQSDEAGDSDAAVAGGQPSAGADDQSAAGAAGGQQGDFDINDLAKMPIPPALREEWLKANGALMTALYKNDKVAQAVLQGIVPQGVHKIESVVHMSLVVFFQINKQLNFMKDAKQISMAFLNSVIAHVVDLATEVKKIPFSDKEVSAAVSAAQEMLLRIHGVTKGQMKAVAQHIPKSALQAGLAKYQAHAKNVHNITGRFNQQGGAPGGAPQGGGSPPQGTQGGGPPQGTPQGGAAPDAGGAPGGAPGGQPQAGAPVTAAPGPGQSAPPGGMLSQAANQPPPGP